MSAPTGSLDAETVLRHPDRSESTPTESLLFDNECTRSTNCASSLLGLSESRIVMPFAESARCVRVLVLGLPDTNRPP